MLIVALTGGIATGKSIVAGVFKDLGCFIHNADLTAHQLMEPNSKAWKSIASHFGESILNADRTINRTKLGDIIFSSDRERRFLNDTIHPLVFKKKKEMVRSLKKEGRYKIFVSEAALTVEAGFSDLFDKVVVVFCDKNIQIKRLMERDNIRKKDAVIKMKSQIQSEEKLKYADYIIETAGSIQDTIEQTERVYRNLMIDYELKRAKSREKI